MTTHNDLANAIRFLAIDAIEQSNSGHPGMPMGMADVATVLFSQFLKFDPARPDWPDRDRFVLSGGHGSMLLYALGYHKAPEKRLIPLYISMPPIYIFVLGSLIGGIVKLAGGEA